MTFTFPPAPSKWLKKGLSAGSTYVSMCTNHDNLRFNETKQTCLKMINYSERKNYKSIMT